MASLKGDGKAIFTIFVGAIIAIVLLTSVADQVFSQTNRVTVTNSTVTAAAFNGTTTLTGRGDPQNVIIYNATGNPAELKTAMNGTGDVSSNFTLTGIVGTDGLLSVTLTTLDEGVNFIDGDSVNVSYDAEPDGHAVDGGDRAIILLITLFGALAVVVFTIVQFMGTGSLMKMMGR